jgi:hypothetical protein
MVTERVKIIVQFFYIIYKPFDISSDEKGTANAAVTTEQISSNK